MTKENFNILLYTPYLTEKLSEEDMNWVKNFQSILKVSINQIVKQEVNIVNSLISNENVDLNSFQFTFQFIFNNNYEEEKCFQNIIDCNKISLVQILCKPDIKFRGIKKDQHFRTYKFYESSSVRTNFSLKIESLKNESWLKILDITLEIKKQIVDSKRVGKPNESIYIAETSSDQKSNRETLVREFNHIGYNVFPNEELSNDMLDYSDNVHELMNKCFISIHIIGNTYSPLINNVEISKVELQNDIFSEVVAAKPELKRYVWIPPNIKPKSEKQRQYIESFKRNIELLKNTEIIQTPIEVFKSIIENSLRIKDKTEHLGKEVKGSAHQAYIISNNNSTKKVSELSKELGKKNIGVLESLQSGSKIDLIHDHKNNLINSDFLFIYYSSDNEQWLNSKISDIIKSPGFGKQKEFKFKAVLVDTDKKPNIKLKIKDLEIINIKNKSISEFLDPVLDKIK